MVLQLLLRKKANVLPEKDWQDYLGLQTHIEDMKNNSTRKDGDSNKWEAVELMSQAALEYSETADTGFDPLGTCVSTFTSKMNHSCNPNCSIIFSGTSLSVRSTRSIPAGGQLSQSYVDRTMPSPRRKSSLQSVYYFACTCEYCRSALVCGLPDLPDSSGSSLSSSDVSNLEAEGIRLYSVAEKAAPPEKAKTLNQAMGLFLHHKDIYPVWRYPWPMIRHEVVLVEMSLGRWYMALGHALKGYFFINPLLYPITWDPLRIVKTFLLANIMIEIQYDRSARTASANITEKLDAYHISWPVAISGLMAEVQAALAKGFGVDSGFARAFEQQRRGLALEENHWQPLWGRERAKLENYARTMVD
ncbi:MAG: hypothetical protein Q9219_002577 [cf. Caloplaca sp. 3 TL-2023]